MASRASALSGYWRAQERILAPQFSDDDEYKANFVIWLLFSVVHHGVEWRDL